MFLEQIRENLAQQKYTILRYGKTPSKIFFPRTGRLIFTKLGMKHRGLQPIILCSNDDPGVTLTYFTARSNLVTFYGKSENSGFFIHASDLKVGRIRHLI